jgi:hypothetical protein
VGEELTPPFHDVHANPSNTIVARTERYTYAAKVLWALCVVQGPFSVAPCPTPESSDSQQRRQFMGR